MQDIHKHVTVYLHPDIEMKLHYFIEHIFLCAYTHTHADGPETHTLPAPSHLLRSPASHSHSSAQTDGITPACRAEQSAAVHFQMLRLDMMTLAVLLM